jgi:glutamate synthase (NADPH/NADH) large chain
MNLPSIRCDSLSDGPYGPESDACAIYLSARKYGQSTFGTLKRSLGALVQMGHRTGFVNGEGDGAGVQTSIPRRLWAKKFSQVNLRSSLTAHPGFWVGHLFIPQNADTPALHDAIQDAFDQANLNLVYQELGRTRPESLGGNARIDPPTFWQLAGFVEFPDLEKRLLEVQTQLETAFPIHFCSLSPHIVVYKVRGSVETLSRYFPDLQDHNYDTSVVLCHARYSTNTVSNFERAQPFALLGHNGEINTITRLRLEAEQIGVVLPKEGSDSQHVDRLLHTLCADYGLDLIEAMETIFPPVPYLLEQFPPELRAVYTRIRQSFGPYAQGPAAILARYGDTIVASVDALGLRPLWFVESEKEYIFSSERGAIPLEIMATEPRALGPGEKMALRLHSGENAELLNQSQIRRYVMNCAFQREAPQLAQQYWLNWENTSLVNPQNNSEVATRPPEKKTASIKQELPPLEYPWQKESAEELSLSFLNANGWNKEHVQDISDIVIKDKEITSLGYDGPLAALANHRVNIADFFKETVAVVTNPAIDRNREAEVFSTSSLLGASPQIGQAPNKEEIVVTVKVPILTGGCSALGGEKVAHQVAETVATQSLEEVLDAFRGHTQSLPLAVMPGETVSGALKRLEESSLNAIQTGAQCLLLDDENVRQPGWGWLDPTLAVSTIDNYLRQAGKEKKQNLRRRTGLVVRSAAIRTLHDIVLLSGFGADAVAPYAMFFVALQSAKNSPDWKGDDVLPQQHLLMNLKAGIEKVISTMGCHELRGYGRVCSSIGLSPRVAGVLKSPNFFGSEEVGLTWERLDRESAQRGSEIQKQETLTGLPHVDRFNPHLWKKLGQFTWTGSGYEDYLRTFDQLKTQHPVALHHIVGIKQGSFTIDPGSVDLTIGDHSLPFIISAMSFGSQGETAFRSYAQAAAKLNILTMNGEGGELREMLGTYHRNRGQQVASGRFGVNTNFLNSAAVIEIKIGQGAKPGEGGMLPGDKVIPRVAEARSTPPFVSLLSPSNNHDLYSIEDLAQLIEELKVVNPQAKISIKCPVVPSIGVIAVGIAKAGADIINLSGYDGGTGAARRHSLQYVGLPVEIGIIQAHRALAEAGLRHKVEIWCDGGMKTGEDAIKMILLGANRVGFATMPMVAIGCTICRRCEEGNCHAGITTQIQSVEEAKQRGLPNFTPLDQLTATSRLCTYFKAMAREMQEIAATLGARHLQDLVGRGDLLEQISGKDQIDLSPMLVSVPVPPRPKLEPGVGRLLVRPRNNLTRLLGELITETVVNEKEREITYQDSVGAIDRALGAHIVGTISRQPALRQQVDAIHLRFGPSSVAGNGFSAWLDDPLDIIIEGGAQDGTAKGACHGRVAVMKGVNHDGLRIDGSVGKSFAYGAQKGTLIVQGNADSRACIRLSGADVIIGGLITQPVNEETLLSATTANLKGFACEYMTAGHVVILGDPGPFAFSGMTGGIVYQMLTPEMGFDASILRKRIALGAQVKLLKLNEADISDLQRLLEQYMLALEQTYQSETADQVHALAQPKNLKERFVKVVPNPSLSEPTRIIYPAEELIE